MINGIKVNERVNKRISVIERAKFVSIFFLKINLLRLSIFFSFFFFLYKIIFIGCDCSLILTTNSLDVWIPLLYELGDCLCTKFWQGCRTKYR